ncbi:MarR family winged helix-turn-helix transcriptional regulator [Kineococcus rhizosphaerae]|uniref:DNA-binding MarR family transcriptional regulator n=1 Tax=Kineococcus rhizosphaerae TaxID=559628 RepID=A0A2T0R2W7_9ACTN|nr:MarR family transcriptional regulator [Kineococcus rhizosphaerae]PRY14125.1 DNA-binding MarR family transcriptional regulator [Kineococcus rhizosphaerae]
MTRPLLEELRSAALLQNAVADALRGTNLTVDRWRCLAHVAHHPGASMTDLAEQLVMAPATASRAVDALVDQALVFRSLDPADRRRVVLRVSPDGAAALAAVSPALPAPALGNAGPR